MFAVIHPGIFSPSLLELGRNNLDTFKRKGYCLVWGIYHKCLSEGTNLLWKLRGLCCESALTWTNQEVVTPVWSAFLSQVWCLNFGRGVGYLQAGDVNALCVPMWLSPYQGYWRWDQSRFSFPSSSQLILLWPGLAALRTTEITTANIRGNIFLLWLLQHQCNYTES